MYYIVDNKVYTKEGDGYRQVSLTAKDKVVVRRELESVTVTPSETVREELPGAQAVTLEEIIAKFNLSEENPILADGMSMPVEEPEEAQAEEPAEAPEEEEPVQSKNEPAVTPKKATRRRTKRA